jgi:transcriptional regulator with XRE-family HTH domain
LLAFATVLNLAKLRRKAGLSQAALARRAGVSQSYVVTLENGTRSNPSMRTMNKIAVALGVSVKALF